jgi:hypothetical protein
MIFLLGKRFNREGTKGREENKEEIRGRKINRLLQWFILV